MAGLPNRKSRWLTVVVFALAMAWVESAVVFYLRTMVGRIEPYQPNPLPLATGLGLAELVREMATLIMLLMVGILAGGSWRSRLGYSAIAFGVWDIFYYVFLKILCGWPHTVFDWDILFLLPMPWWGPVLAPVSIALLLIVWGTLVNRNREEGKIDYEVPPPSCRGTLARQGEDDDEEYENVVGTNWRVWWLNVTGIALALYVFMADNLRVAGRGVDAWRNVLPSRFRWPLFWAALLLMAAPVMEASLRPGRRRRTGQPPLDCAKWLAHFARNHEHRPEPIWTAPTTLPPGVLAPLRRSLEQFQLGDGGGPASLIARDAERFRSSTAQMRALVDGWFAEEREHSRLLGCAVDGLGGQRIASHWSFSAFCLARRVLGVGFELKVLLLTEITSTVYYRLLQRHSPITALAATCALSLRDEAGHVAFHCDRLAAAGRSSRGLWGGLWAAQFCLFGFAAATMLWLNHGKCLLRLGATRSDFFLEVGRELRRFLKCLTARIDLPIPSGIPAEFCDDTERQMR